MPLSIVNIRMSNETKARGVKQAKTLGLNLAEYIRLIIELDIATKLINKLEDVF